jgi:hypothetical protein
MHDSTTHTKHFDIDTQRTETDTQHTFDVHNQVARIGSGVELDGWFYALPGEKYQQGKQRHQGKKGTHKATRHRQAQREIRPKRDKLAKIAPELLFLAHAPRG